MQIYLRIIDNKKIKVIMNKLFISEKNIKVKLYPIPNWIKNPKCQCGKKADYVLEDVSLICKKCLEDVLNVTTKLYELKDVNIPIIQETIKMLRFEWSTDKNRWYHIRGENIQPANWENFLESIKELITKNKSTLQFNAEYDKNVKTLKLW